MKGSLRSGSYPARIAGKLTLILLLLVALTAAGVYLGSPAHAFMQIGDGHAKLGENGSRNKLTLPADSDSPASIKVYTGNLTGNQEVPPSGSPATGSVTVTVNPAANTMRVQVTFSGLGGVTTSSRIHCCAGGNGYGQNAGMATTDLSGFPLGVTSGTYDQTFDMTQAASYDPPFITANGGTVAAARDALFVGLNSLQTYLNIPTSAFPNGEIRAYLAQPSRQAVTGWGVSMSGAANARDSLRIYLGGGTVAGPNGSFGGVRREINWDDVPDSMAAPNNMPADFFNVNSPRGAVFSTPGSGLQVSGSAGVSPVNFGNIDSAYSTTFSAFSTERQLTALGSNIVDINFFVPGTSTPALTRGFGAVFNDVDVQGPTTITLYDVDNVSLGTFIVPTFGPSNPAFPPTYSFVGVSFASPLIKRARIVSGNAALAAGINDGGSTDLVVVDDIIYGEPTAATVARVSVSGRVMTAEGRGIRNARIIMTDQHGASNVVQTGPRGEFEFANVLTGESYVVTVSSRRFSFEPRSISVNDNVSGLVFTPSGGSSRDR
jgi:hypothetical protein